MRVIFIFVTCFCLLVQSIAKIQPRTSPTMQPLKEKVLQRLAKEEGHYAVAFKDLQTSATLFLNEQQMMHAASTMKVPVMIEVFKQANAGRFSLLDSVVVTNEFKSIVDGSHYSLDLSKKSSEFIDEKNLGAKVTIRDLVHHMITISSNLAANLLIQKVGADRITASMRALGAEHIQVLRGVEDQKAYDRGLHNKTDALDLLIILEAIAENKVVSPEACEQMIGIMLEQKYRDRIPAKLPADVKVAHKTGSITKINHDAGIIFLPDGRRYILVLMSEGVAEQAKSSAVMAELSRMFYDWMLVSK